MLEGNEINTEKRREWLPDSSVLERYLKFTPDEQAIADANMKALVDEYGEGAFENGLVIFRAMPPHALHIESVKQAIAVTSKKVYIGLASANRRNDNNPWSGLQRSRIIHRELTKQGIPEDRFQFMYLNEYDNAPVWANAIEEEFNTMGVKIDVVVSNNEQMVGNIFEARDYTVLRPPVFAREKYNSTGIRKKLRENGELVPFGLKPKVKALTKV